MCWHVAVFSGSFWDVCDKHILLGGVREVGGGRAVSQQPKIKLDLTASDVMVQISEVRSTSPLSST